MKKIKTFFDQKSIKIWLILLIIILSLRIFLSSIYFELYPNPNKKVIVVFRNDDIQEFASTDIDLKLFRIFKNSKIPQTYALVPFKYDLKQNKKLLKHLKEHLKLGLAEIALHGYEHKNIGNTRTKREYLGMPLDEQITKTHCGKIYLETLLNTKIITFIPSFNAYDLNTIKALNENNMKVLSSSTFFNYINRVEFIIVNPNCVLTAITAKELKLASNYGEDLSIIIVYYHSHMGNLFIEDDYHGRIKQLIEQIKNLDNIEVLTLGQVGLKYHNYFKQRYLTDILHGKAGVLLRFLKQKKLHKKLQELMICGYVKKLLYFSVISICAIFVFLFLAGFGVSVLLNLKRWNKHFLYLISICSIVLWVIIVMSYGGDVRIGMIDSACYFLY